MDINNVLTVVMAGGNGNRLYPLTRDRAKPAVPFGGIYRLIDFTLSNCINSGLRKILVLTQYKTLSLERHLRRAWNIFHPELDEFIIPVPPQMRINDDWYKGTADAVYQNLYVADQYQPTHFLILSSDHVYQMDYARILAFHHAKRADATVATIEVGVKQSPQFGIMEVDASNRIISFKEKPQHPQPLPGTKDVCLANMGVYVFNADVLREFLEQDASRESHHDFGKDLLPTMITKARVFAYNFKNKQTQKPGYWRDVGTIDAYFKANMDLLRLNPPLNPYNEEWPFRTYQPSYPPAKFVFAGEYKGGKSGMALDSIVSEGCVIHGGEVRNCILSPGVRVNPHAEVSDSILMEGVEIGKHSKVRRTILDKNVTVPPGTVIGYDLNEDKKRFTVTDSGIVVIPKGMRVSPPRPNIANITQVREVIYHTAATYLNLLETRDEHYRITSGRMKERFFTS